MTREFLMGTRLMLGCLLSVVLLGNFLCFVPNETLAADAWVLWVEEERFWNPKDRNWGSRTHQWKVLDATSSEPDCRRKLRETIERVSSPDQPPKGVDVMYKVTGTTITLLFFPKGASAEDTAKGSQVFHYVCLPETLDPREPRTRQ